MPHFSIKMFPRRAWRVLVLASLSFSVGMSAQNTNATIRGQVLDPSGAMLPNARVEVVSQSTGVVAFSGVTDSAGQFVLPQVLPDTYRVTVTAEGLKTFTLGNLLATVSQVTAVNVQMQLGHVDEVVDVMTRGEQLDRATSTVSTVIAPQDVSDLPLSNRSSENLLAFVPGVATGGNPTSVNTAQISINGSRTLNTEFLLNGVSLVIASTGQPAVLPSPDGIDELRFLTSNAPADYGRTSGAVLSANTRFGTNAFHGTLYSLVQNEALNANTYFNKIDPANIQQRPRRRYFQFGGSLGGPLVIPHLLKSRDKLFFFVNYDKTLQRNTSTLVLTVPDADKRKGIFRPIGDASKMSRIYRPQSSTLYPIDANGVQTVTDPFDSAATKILALMPLPNFSGTLDAPNGRYTGNLRQSQTLSPATLRLSARVDSVVSSKDRLSINLYRYNTQAPNQVVYGSELLNTASDCVCNDTWLPSVDYTRTWTPTLVTDLNMGFFRNAAYRTPPGSGLNASAALGIGGLPLDQTPQITYNGYNNVGADTNTNQVNITNTFAPFGTVTKIVGTHAMRFGAQLRKNQFNSFNPSGSPQGTINFSGAVTNRGLTGNATTGMADFLLGNISSGNYQTPQPETGRRNYNVGIFVQDDWKATPKLTLNLGLRYEYESPVTVANDVYSRLDPLTGTLLAAGINSSRSLNIETPKRDFSPRVGLAYSVSERTVLRAAFGTFYGTVFQNLGGQVAFPGYDVTQNFRLNPNTEAVSTPAAGVPLTYRLSEAFSNADVDARDLKNPFGPILAATVQNPLSSSGVSFDRLNPMPMVQQWIFGVQRELPLGLVLEVNYVGNHSLHLPYIIPFNVVPFTQANAQLAVTSGGANSVAVQSLRPFHRLTQFGAVEHVGMSNYNSLQLNGRRQFHRQFSILSSYTYAKAMDDGSTIYNFAAPNGSANAQYVADSRLRKLDYAVSNIDIKHRVNVAMEYRTTGSRWVRDLVVATAFVGQTGLPVNITQGNDGVVDASQQRPNGRAQDVVLKHPYFDGTVLRYFKTPSSVSAPVADTSFPLTPAGVVQNTARNGFLVPGTLGTMPRDAARAFGLMQFDASVSKTFTIYRELSMQVRVDAFNVLNHTNFNAPNASLSAGADCVKLTSGTGSGQCAGPEVANFRASSNGFGQITSAQSPRSLQLVGRVSF